MKIILLEL